MQPLRSGQFTILQTSALAKTCSVIGHSAQEFYVIAQSRVAGRVLADAWQRFGTA